MNDIAHHHSTPIGERLCPLHIDRWTGPFAADQQAKAVDALEHGKVLVFPHLAFPFETDEQGLFTPALSNGKSKNVSLKTNGELGGTKADGEEARALKKMMERFAGQATRFLETLIPQYAGRLERAPTSYRPVEIHGRPASVIHDDTRLHVDAFPSRPMRGRRIMRLFTNVNPKGHPRIWHVGEPFEAMATKLGDRAREGSRLHASVLSTLGVTKGARSAYDSVMLGLHDGAKRDDVYQKTSPQIEVPFPSGTTWICYTDQVMHAALAGQYVLEQTFHLDVDAMARPELSPLKVLERLRGRALV
ncbi:MAG TPA: Kdo hydroxylase family protein [Rhizomicrobium sp.]|nr:Kdo hydroxylase family protein [Rhizomicrobium sp.]